MMPFLTNNDTIQELHNIVLQYFAEEKWQEAYTACMTITQIYPDFPLAYQTLGQICQKLQKLDEAIEWHEQAINLDPNLVEAQANLGSIYNYQKQWQKAIAPCEKALALSPGFQPVRRILIHAYHKIPATVDIAQRQYELWQVNPTYFTPQEILTLANRLTDYQKVDLAITCYEYLTKNHPDFSPIPYEKLMTFYQQKKDWDKTKYFYQQLVSNFADYSDLANIHQNMGQLFLQEEKWLEAQDSFQQAIALQPDLSNSHHSLGDLFCRQTKYDLALHHYATAIELAPDSWLTYHRMADIYKTQGDLHRAIAHYQKAIAINPEFVWAIYALGRTYFDVGQKLAGNNDHETACEYYIKAIEHHPEYPWFIYFTELVGYLNKHEQLAPVKAVYQKITANNPDTITAYTSLGDVYTIQGDIPQAIECYERACFNSTKHHYPDFVEQYWQKEPSRGPNFMIIGAQKCGTTSLEGYMSEHPQIIRAIKKEIHFWAWHVNRGIDWYLSHFPHIPPESGYMTGEATPNYLEQLANLNSIQRIYDHFPQIKLLVVLRNPIDRAFSQYHHWCRLQWEKRSFNEAVEEELSLLEATPSKPQGEANYWQNTFGYIGRGVYIEFLQKWLDIFPRQQFLILDSHTFYTQTTETLEKVWHFLDLPSHQLTNYRKMNAGSYKQSIPPEIRSKLQEYFAPHNARLEEFLEQKFDWQG